MSLVRSPSRRLLVGVVAAVGVVGGGTGVVQAAFLAGGRPKPGVSNFGRRVHPGGRLTQLSYFPTGAALASHGRFVLTVSAGRYANVLEVTRLADGAVVDRLKGPADRAYEGGVAVAPDGLHAYVSEAHDRVIEFRLDPRTGHARETRTLVIPVAAGAQPPDNFPPQSDGARGYPSGLAVSPDGRVLAVALNLDDRVALVDLPSGKVAAQVDVRPDGRVGDRAYPRGVAIAGGRVLVTDEGDGTVASFPLADPAAVRRVTPAAPADPRGVDAAKTHPDGIVAAPDGRSVYVSLSNDDRVLQLDSADPSRVLHTFDVGRREGLGTEPTGLALTPDGGTLFVACAGEDVVRVIALKPRGRLLPGDEIARIPSGIYPDAVAFSPSNGRLAIVAAKGTGPGPIVPNRQAADNDSVSHRVIGLLQTLALPRDAAARDASLRAYGRGGSSQPIPLTRRVAGPAGTPVVGPGGGASSKIKYVFYVVAENKSYDTQLGDLPRGDGDPCLVLYGARRVVPRRRDGRPCPVQRFISKANVIRSPGQRMDRTPITPNQHRLASDWVTLDRTFTNAETSDDGHNWTAGAYTSDFEMRQSLSENSPAGRPAQALVYPAAQPPKGYLFDAASSQGKSFFNYGEAIAGVVVPDSQQSPKEQAVRSDVRAHSAFTDDYPSDAAIDKDILPPYRTVYDSVPPHALNPSTEISRMVYLRQRLGTELARCVDPSKPALCGVPQFNALTFPNNHTGGVSDPTRRTPDALVRDNDLAIGQLVDYVSHSKIWPYSAIFVIQDDAQDGADHVDGHRVQTLVASPYARRGAVVSTHYDTVSVISTVEHILGMRPAYLFDAVAAPMWDVFQGTPNLAPYAAQPIPDKLLEEKNSPHSAERALSKRYSWRTDTVPETVANRVAWAYRYGTPRACPARGRGVVGNPCALPPRPRRGHR